MGEIQLPPHWKLVKLGDVCEFIYGKTLPKSQRESGSIPVYGSNGIIDWHNQAITSTQTIVIGRKGSIGKVNISSIPCFPIDTTYYIDDVKQPCDFYYLYYTLSRLNLSALNSSVAVPGLNRNDAYAKVIYLPPLSEQKTIAHTLQTIQKAKETCQRELELEREHKAALMQYLFTHGTHNEPRKQTKVGEIPNSWKVIKLGQICESSAYGPRFSGNLYNPNGTIATLRTTDIDKDGNINYSTMPFASLELRKFKTHLIQIKDLLITRSGTCGIAAVFESYNSPVIPGAFLIRFRLNEYAEPYFLRYYINSHLGRKRITQLASGAVQKNISGTSLLNWLIPLPTIPEQLKIVGILRTCDRKIQALEKEIALTDELFHAMLEQLMTGKISTQPLTETYV
ncbi:restriction endonuclease subunit S [Nostoc sp.]|uniref:restriction endonuclease subunit S n=1 Tax=Nostoc sp. TaxID=1180 RepID=UPI002FF90ECF